jgi:hypothetical protein
MSAYGDGDERMVEFEEELAGKILTSIRGTTFVPSGLVSG